MNSKFKKAILVGSCLLTVGTFGAMAQGPRDCDGPDRKCPPDANESARKLARELGLDKEQSRKFVGLLKERIQQKREFRKMLEKMLTKKQMRKLGDMMHPRKDDRGPRSGPPEDRDRGGRDHGKRPEVTPEKLGRELGLKPKQADKLFGMIKTEEQHDKTFKKKLAKQLSPEQMRRLRDMLKRMRDDNRPPRPPQEERGHGWD
ncbi:MAG: hypothetical protein GY750_18290 [Lentisphaerae bacterium]|nr:hypothetical protein [Lentisphaerota bacterium]MCP4103347.1 hypothetical protein [Lentisphaerota bacterium]